jgi:hypothetical protein
VLSEIQQAQVSRLLADYCEASVRPDVRDKLRLGFRITGNAVVLFEARPAFEAPREWHESPFAKFVYVKSRGQWQLYCQHRDLKWHRYQRLHGAATFEELLAEVDSDPTGIFKG